MQGRLRVLFLYTPIIFLLFLAPAFYFQPFNNVFFFFNRKLVDPRSANVPLAIDHRPNNQQQNFAVIDPPLLHRSTPSNSVLLPDWQAILLLPPNSPPPPNLTCHFPNGHVSAARLAGNLPSGGGATILCSVPAAVRRLLPLLSPFLIYPSPPSVPNPPILRYDRPIVYESISTEADVVLFAKGPTKRPGFVETYPAHLRCAFLVAGEVSGETPVITAAQGVFRCPHPAGIPAGDRERIAVTLDVGVRERKLIPSVAVYRAPPVNSGGCRSEICACTMVRDVAKFLPEWVIYHSGIGVDRFVLYDNGSEDRLEQTVDRLTQAGFNISTRYWPWPKTQEAGFAHCAVAERHTCEWVMFADVDEFVFSPCWSGSPKPNRTMLPSLLPTRQSKVGQVTLSCREFGPSGLTLHPSSGVMQGYTCRRRVVERHKSLVRLEAVSEGSLVNSIHHFGLNKGWATKRVAARRAVVNHYRYQAWIEFKAKFRGRASAYVVDWTNGVNRGSKDRAPGLGLKAVEPEGWVTKFCEVKDYKLRDAARRWFRTKRGIGDKYRMPWEQ